jgi:hypothetical protein
MSRSITAVVLIAVAFAGRPHTVATTPLGQTDLDAFMQQVLARRDDNWKKLQQYILDEREDIDVQGPARVSLWREQRDFTWYIRDGYFVRSPVKVNGVVIGDADRRKYEEEYLQRVQRRDRRGDATPSDGAETAAASAPADVASVIRQSRQPEFISSAYFLRFKFDAGTYALVGRERLEDRDVLRIEYYPTKLFSGRPGDRRTSDGQDRREGRDGKNRAQDDAMNAAMRRLLNKVALITLWIEPESHQILKYTYNNVALDFLPAQWLVHVDDVKASMTMGQPFPDVWLPRTLDLNAAFSLAIGAVEFRMALNYRDYRQADATVKIR